MGSETKIAWAHHTLNPWRGCAKVAPECDNCYAEVMSHRRSEEKMMNPCCRPGIGHVVFDGDRVVCAECGTPTERPLSRLLPPDPRPDQTIITFPLLTAEEEVTAKLLGVIRGVVSAQTLAQEVLAATQTIALLVHKLGGEVFVADEEFHRPLGLWTTREAGGVAFRVQPLADPNEAPRVLGPRLPQPDAGFVE